MGEWEVHQVTCFMWLGSLIVVERCDSSWEGPIKWEGHIGVCNVFEILLMSVLVNEIKINVRIF